MTKRKQKFLELSFIVPTYLLIHLDETGLYFMGSKWNITKNRDKAGFVTSFTASIHWERSLTNSIAQERVEKTLIDSGIKYTKVGL